MKRSAPLISVEQVGAFVKLVELGTLKSASLSLHVSEEGLRRRLITLEERLGVRLYEKARGRRGNVQITQAGRNFFGKASRFLEDAHALAQPFDPGSARDDLLIAASQYLTHYVLIDAIRKFRLIHPSINVRLLTRTEQEILAAMRTESGVDLGICAPPEVPEAVDCKLWFSLSWYLVAPRHHRLLSKSSIALEDLVDEPLVVFESGSTGRQHVLEAFYQRGVEPHIVMEATSTQAVVRMVEADMGVAILPLLPSGIVTQGLDVGFVPVAVPVRPIDTCIVSRMNQQHDSAASKFQSFLHASVP